MQKFSQNNYFDPNSSPNFQHVPGATFDVDYDVGEIGANGIVGLDIVTVGGISVPDMPIGLATNITGEEHLISPDHDGLMGLGWPASQNTIAVNGEPEPGPTFMIAVQSYLDEPVFTADFRADHPKSLAFGFVNSSLYTGNLNTIPVDSSSGFWALNSVTFSSGSNSLGSLSGIDMIMGAYNGSLIMHKLIASQTLEVQGRL